MGEIYRDSKRLKSDYKINSDTNGSITECNDITNIKTKERIICPEMCYFCFDIIYCHLQKCDPPKTPNFSNDS